MRFDRCAHDSAVFKDAAHQRIQFGIDLVLKEFPQVFDLVRRFLLNH